MLPRRKLLANSDHSTPNLTSPAIFAGLVQEGRIYFAEGEGPVSDPALPWANNLHRSQVHTAFQSAQKNRRPIMFQKQTFETALAGD